MIPYGKHFIDEDDISSVVRILRDGQLTQGPAIESFESAICEKVGSKFALRDSISLALRATFPEEIKPSHRRLLSFLLLMQSFIVGAPLVLWISMNDR